MNPILLLGSLIMGITTLSKLLVGAGYFDAELGVVAAYAGYFYMFGAGVIAAALTGKIFFILAAMAVVGFAMIFLGM